MKWAAPDRCVLTITDSQQATAMAPLVAQAARQWLAQLGQPAPEPSARGLDRRSQ